jgi:hypothetical protein
MLKTTADGRPQTAPFCLAAVVGQRSQLNDGLVQPVVNIISQSGKLAKKLAQLPDLEFN